MRIALRMKGGWSERVENKDKKNCDVCGAPLWQGPGVKNIYCDAVHTEKEVEKALTKK